MSRYSTPYLGPLVVILILAVGAWFRPDEFMRVADHAAYFLPSLVLVLASWGKIGHAFGIHNLFRDDAQLFGPKAPQGRWLARLLASPAFWSGAGFAATFGYAWIITWGTSLDRGHGLPVALAAASTAFLWAAGAALARPLADLTRRPVALGAAELLRVALGLALGFAFCWAAWSAADLVAGDEPSTPRAAPWFHPHAVMFLAAFLGLCMLFRRVRLKASPGWTAAFGLGCAVFILICLWVLAMEVSTADAPRALWLASWAFMIPVTVVFGLQNSLPCVSMACIGLGLMATGQLAPVIWSTLLWLTRVLTGQPAPFAAVVAVVTAVACLVAINGWRQRLRLPGFDYGERVNPQDPKATQNPDAGPSLTPVEALAAGRRRLGAAGGQTLIIVCLSGGAYRATFWSSLILDRLCGEQERFPRFQDSVRLITGASGGMVAGAYFTALRAQNDGRLPPEGITRRIEADSAAVQHARGRRFPVERDGLSTVVHQFAQWDLRDLVVPGGSDCDRGVALEKQWLTLDGQTFQGIEEAARKGEAPSIILSPMLVETGAPAIFSNLDLHCLVDDPHHKISVELFKVFRGFGQISLATAVRLNASFPYVSPGVSLPTKPERRPVDAGYYDNFGIDLATDYLDCDAVFDHLCPRQGRAPFSRIAVIQIRAFPSDAPTPRPGPLARALQGFTTPIEGIASARRSSQIFGNDQSLAASRRRYQERLGEDAFGVFTLEADVDVSLSWYTREDEMAALRQLLDPPSEEELERLGNAQPTAEALQQGDLKALADARILRRKKIADTLQELSDFLRRPEAAAASRAAE